MCLVRAALEYVDVVSSQCISSIVAWKYNMACQNMNINMQWNTKCFHLTKLQSIYLQVKKFEYYKWWDTESRMSQLKTI